MKGLFTVVCFLCSLTLSAKSHQTMTLYGLERAEHYRMPIKKPVYIQLGSFKHQANANKVKAKLQTQLPSAQILIKKNGALTAVLIGPYTSHSEISATIGKIRNHSSRLTQTSRLPQKEPLKLENLSKKKRALKPTQTQRSRPSHDLQTISDKNKKLGSSKIINPKSLYFTIGGGVFFPNEYNTIQINNNSDFPAPFSNDIYATQNSNHPTITLALGKQWQRNADFIPTYSAGVMWQYFFRRNVGQTIMQYSDPLFLDYEYHWNVESHAILAYGKANLFRYKMVSPFILGGLGTALNRTSAYTESAITDVTPRISPAFGNNNKTQFAYKVGIGADLFFDKQMLFSLGYNYQDLGSLHSKQGTGTWSGDSLNLGKYAGSEILATMSYVFW